MCFFLLLLLLICLDMRQTTTAQRISYFISFFFVLHSFGMPPKQLPKFFEIYFCLLLYTLIIFIAAEVTAIKTPHTIISQKTHTHIERITIQTVTMSKGKKCGGVIVTDASEYSERERKGGRTLMSIYDDKYILFQVHQENHLRLWTCACVCVH